VNVVGLSFSLAIILLLFFGLFGPCIKISLYQLKLQSQVRPDRQKVAKPNTRNLVAGLVDLGTDAF
jgi:hypothetical protein